MAAYIIWHATPNDRISDAKEVVGVVTTGWQDADAVVEKLNSEDDESPSWSRRRNYWKEEVSVLADRAHEGKPLIDIIADDN